MRLDLNKAKRGPSLKSLLTSLCLLLFYAETRAEVILEEEFNDLSRWKDLSKLIPWGAHPKGTSAFTTAKSKGVQAVQLDAGAIPHTGYANTTDLKTFTALDFVFPSPIVHRADTLTVSFRAYWDQVTGDAGEAGRIVLILLDEYPASGLNADKFNDPTGDPFGTPGIHARIRPSTNSKSFLQYGGGHGGELEFYSKDANQWWLPGFIQNALCSCCPDCADKVCCMGSPGTGREYPAGSWKATTASLGGTDWKDFTYKVLPHRQELYQNGNLVGAMDLPETSKLPNAPGYEYYEKFQALRLYWRGNVNAHIANFKISHTAVTVTTHPSERVRSESLPMETGYLAKLDLPHSAGILIPMSVRGMAVYNLKGVQVWEHIPKEGIDRNPVVPWPKAFESGIYGIRYFAR